MQSEEGGRKDAADAAAAVYQWRGGEMLLRLPRPWRDGSIKRRFGCWLFLLLGSLDEFIAGELRMAAVY